MGLTPCSTEEQPPSAVRIITAPKNDHEGSKITESLGRHRQHCRFGGYRLHGHWDAHIQPIMEDSWSVASFAADAWRRSSCCCGGDSHAHPCQSPEAATNPRFAAINSAWLSWQAWYRGERLAWLAGCLQGLLGVRMRLHPAGMSLALTPFDGDIRLTS